ncbi:MAG: hypothetical protein ACJ0J5_04915 [Dehalococcoidia bacterium]|nr:hypothetical protein [Chloroflexota bacterium]MBP05639.1 hypothetical protein [Chloroflexota bacterium]RZP14026.1 MAG: hypothetical protein EVA32_00205 [Chloroflexota bacterium]
MKSIDKLLNSNTSEIGFNKQNYKGVTKLNILGLTSSQINENKFECSSYILSDIEKKSSKSKGKYINVNDTNKSIENFDFIILQNTNETKINLLSYEKPVGMQINHDTVLTELRLSTLDSFDFDLYIYKINNNLIFNFEEVLKMKDILNSIRSNWFIFLDENNLSQEEIQYIYDLGFVGIVLDLDKLSLKDFNKIKTNIKKIEEKKNGKI